MAGVVAGRRFAATGVYVGWEGRRVYDHRRLSYFQVCHSRNLQTRVPAEPQSNTKDVCPASSLKWVQQKRSGSTWIDLEICSLVTSAAATQSDTTTLRASASQS